MDIWHIFNILAFENWKKNLSLHSNTDRFLALSGEMVFDSNMEHQNNYMGPITIRHYQLPINRGTKSGPMKYCI